MSIKSLDILNPIIGLVTEDQNKSLQDWREHTFTAVLSVGVIAGLIAYLINLTNGIKRHDWLIVTIISVAIIWVLCIRFIPNLPYKTRVIGFLLMFYYLSLSTGIAKAAVGDSRIWFMSGSILAAVFLGGWAGTLSFGISLVSWIAIGLLFQNGILDYPYAHLVDLIRPGNFFLWTNTGISIFATGMTVMASITAILSNLNKSYERSRSLTTKLKEEISERKLAEERLRGSEEKYRHLVYNSPNLIIEIDEDFFILALNPAMAKSLGHEADSLVGVNILTILPKEANKHRIEAAQEALADNKTISFEDEREGRFFQNIFVPSMERRTVQIIAHDITERKRAENILVEYQQHLEDLVDERTDELRHEMVERKRAEKAALAAQKLADLGMLTTGVAHELNSPLQGIMSTSDYLLMSLDKVGSDPAFLREQVESINENVLRCAKIVHSLRFYARTSPDDFTPQKIDKLIKNTLLLTKHQFELYDNVSIVTEIAEDIPPLICSRDQIMQVLINLLTNARDAMPDGGQITIQASHYPEHSQILLRVIDNGQGIPNEFDEQIFKPFFTTKPVGKGIGLGLFIVAGIVRAHGGDIDVRSIPDEGTTFTLTFSEHPCQDPLPPAMLGRYADWV
ncbi:MAG: ATP-binding protein [Chloroflexota bacterium]|nr:ATP-binding protein [Chloroflexota bacterium]